MLLLALLARSLSMESPGADSFAIMADSVLRAAYKFPCSCLHLMAVDAGRAADEVAIVTHSLAACSVFTSNHVNTSVNCNNLIITTKNALMLSTILNIPASNRTYASVVVFFSGNPEKLSDVVQDESVATVLVTHSETGFNIMDIAENTLLARWDTHIQQLVYAAEVSLPWFNSTVVSPKMREVNRLGIKVSLFSCPPFVTYTRRPINGSYELDYDGIEVRILRAMARRWNIMFVPQDDPLHGVNATDPWTSVVGDLIFQRSDVSLCSLWITPPRLKHISLTAPWTTQLVSFLAPKPVPMPLARILYLPFEYPVWIVWTGFQALVTVVFYLVARTIPRGRDTYYGNVRNSILSVARVNCLNPRPVLPTHDALRFLLVAWTIFSLLFTTCYLTRYTSLLASPQYSAPFDTITDLVRAGIYWGERYNFMTREMEKTGNEDVIAFARMFRLEKNDNDREDRLRGGRYAIFVKTMNRYVVGAEQLSETSRRKLRLIGEPLFAYFIGLGLQKKSPLKFHFDSTLRRLMYGGLIEQWVNDVIRKLNRRYMEGLFKDRDDIQEGPQPLSLEATLAAFYVFLIGHLTAAASFACEIALSKWCGSNMYPGKLNANANRKQ